MSKETAIEEYVKLLLDRCPIFRQYLEEQRLEVGEKDRLRYSWFSRGVEARKKIFLLRRRRRLSYLTTAEMIIISDVTLPSLILFSPHEHLFYSMAIFTSRCLTSDG